MSDCTSVIQLRVFHSNKSIYFGILYRTCDYYSYTYNNDQKKGWTETFMLFLTWRFKSCPVLKNKKNNYCGQFWHFYCLDEEQQKKKWSAFKLSWPGIEPMISWSHGKLTSTKPMKRSPQSGFNCWVWNKIKIR